MLWRLAPALRVGEDSSGGSAALARRFGPRNCVEVRKSAQGTCEIVASCAAEDDLSSVEFAFICQNGTRKQKHTFGVGSFANTEAYDSGVSCERCRDPVEPAPAPSAPAPPPPAAAPGLASGLAPQSQPTPLPGKMNVTANVIQALGKEAGYDEFAGRGAASSYNNPREISLTGPEHCIRTFRSSDGTCVMETRCKKVDTRGFSFGFTCVMQDGGSTRHIFEPNALAPEERFDTEVICENCLGLDTRPPDEVATPATAKGKPPGPPHALQRAVKELADSMKGIVQEFHWLTSNVTRIKNKVDPPKPELAKNVTEAPAKPAQALVRNRVHRSHTLAGKKSRRAAHRRARHAHAKQLRQLRHRGHRHGRGPHRPHHAGHRSAFLRRRAEQDADGREAWLDGSDT